MQDMPTRQAPRDRPPPCLRRAGGAGCARLRDQLVEPPSTQDKLSQNITAQRILSDASSFTSFPGVSREASNALKQICRDSSLSVGSRDAEAALRQYCKTSPWERLASMKSRKIGNPTSQRIEITTPIRAATRS
jgi:hypothetical protein